jgi:hypothetical protein
MDVLLFIMPFWNKQIHHNGFRRPFVESSTDRPINGINGWGKKKVDK